MTGVATTTNILPLLVSAIQGIQTCLLLNVCPGVQLDEIKTHQQVSGAAGLVQLGLHKQRTYSWGTMFVGC